MSFDKNFEHDRELFEYALDEFSSQGFERASINTILEKAGMSKGQFYYHFRSKEELYLALIGEVVRRKQVYLGEAMHPEEFEQDIFSIFRIQMKYAMAFAQEHPEVSRFAESFLREKGSTIYRKALSLYNFENNEQIANLVDRANQRSELRDDMPPQFIQNLIGYLFTHSGDLANLIELDDFDRGMNYIISFLKDGLAKRDMAEREIKPSIKVS